MKTAVVLVSLALSSCLACNFDSTQVEQQKVEPPKTTYVRCESATFTRTCRAGTSCLSGETRKPADRTWTKLRDCNEAVFYYLCYNKQADVYACRSDIPGCVKSTSPLDVRLNENQYYTTTSSCLLSLPGSIVRCLNETDRVCRPVVSAGNQPVGCQTALKEMNEPSATNRFWDDLNECRSETYKVGCYSIADDTVTYVDDLILCGTGQVQITESLDDTALVGFEDTLKHVRCATGSYPNYSNRKCRPAERVDYNQVPFAQPAPYVVPTLGDACGVGEDIPVAQSIATVFENKADCEAFYACRPCYIASNDGGYNVTGVSDVSGALQCSNGVILPKSPNPYFSEQNQSIADGFCETYYTDSLTMTHVRCEQPLATDVVICRPEHGSNQGCPSGEDRINTAQAFGSLTHCNSSRFACRPCYTANAVDTVAEFTMSASQDYEDTPCATGVLLTFPTATYYSGSDKTSNDAYCEGYYTPTLEVAHVRCYNDDYTDDVACRPKHAANSGCPSFETRINAVQEYTTLALCSAVQFACRPCYTASAENYTMSASHDFESSPCSGGVILPLSLATFHTGSDRSTVDNYCTSFYTDVLEFPHVRCKNDAAEGDVVCRPEHASGCPSGEARINSAQLFDSLSECSDEIFACSACYEADPSDGSYDVSASYDHESPQCSAGVLLNAVPTHTGSNLTAVTEGCENYYTSSTMFTHVRCYNPATVGSVVCRPLHGATADGCPAGEKRLNNTQTYTTLAQCEGNKHQYVSCYNMSTNDYECLEDWRCYNGFGGNDDKRTLSSYTVLNCDEFDDFVPSPWYRCVFRNATGAYDKCRPVEECWDGVDPMNPEIMIPDAGTYRSLGFESYSTNTKLECDNMTPYIACYNKNDTVNDFDCIADYNGPCEDYAPGTYVWLPNNRYFVSQSSCEAFRPTTWMRCIDDTLQEAHCRPYDMTTYGSCDDNIYALELAPSFGNTNFLNFGSCDAYRLYVSCYEFQETSATTSGANFVCSSDFEMCNSTIHRRIPNSYFTTNSLCSSRNIPFWIRCAYNQDSFGGYAGVVCRPYDESTQTGCPAGEAQMPGPRFTSFATCYTYDARRSCYNYTSTNSDEAFTCDTTDYQVCDPASEEQVPPTSLFASSTLCGQYRHNAWIRCYSETLDAEYCRPYQVITDGNLTSCTDYTTPYDTQIPNRIFGTRDECKAFQHFWICYDEATNALSCRSQNSIGDCEQTYPELPFGTSTECEDALDDFEYNRCRVDSTNEMLCRPSVYGCISGETLTVPTNFTYTNCINEDRNVICYIYGTDTFECRPDIEECSSGLEFRFPIDTDLTIETCPDDNQPALLASLSLSGDYYRCVEGSTIVCRPAETNCSSSETRTPADTDFDTKTACEEYSESATPTPVACYDSSSNYWSCVATCSGTTLQTFGSSTECDDYLFDATFENHTDWIRCNSLNGRYCAPYGSNCAYDGAEPLPSYQNETAMFGTQAACQSYTNFYSCYNYASNSFKCEADYTGCGSDVQETARIPVNDFETLSECSSTIQTSFIRCVDARTGRGTLCRPEIAGCPDFLANPEVRSPQGVTYGNAFDCYNTKLYYMCYQRSSPATDSSYKIKCRTDEIGCNHDACGSGWLNPNVCEAPARLVPSPTTGIEFNAFNTKTACENIAWYRCRSGTVGSYTYACRPRGGEVEEDGDEINNGCLATETRVPNTITTYPSVTACLTI